MNKYEKALALDIQQNIERAANAYEDVIKMSDTLLDAYLNLACLYWESTDFGFNAGMHLSSEFISMAERRMWEVLNEAETKYADYPEIKFWRLYFQFTTLGEQPFVDQCLEFVKYPKSSLVPYLHIYTQTKDKIHLPKAKLLYQEALQTLTTKNRYIVGVLEKHMENETYRFTIGLF